MLTVERNEEAIPRGVNFASTVNSIDRELIADIGEPKAKASSPATANRYLALIRAILCKAALKWEWTDRAPKVRLYREAKRRVRFIMPEQAHRLLAELPAHQRDVVCSLSLRGCGKATCCG